MALRLDGAISQPLETEIKAFEALIWLANSRVEVTRTLKGSLIQTPVPYRPIYAYAKQNVQGKGHGGT